MNSRTIQIAPSILAADFLNLADQIRQCEAAGADLLHCDVMDGHFVPNLTFGPPLIKQLHRATKLELDVHLMIKAPERSVDQYRDAGAAAITVHQEVSPHLHRTLSHIKASGAKAGVALNPSTPLDTLADIADQIDLLLIMTVNPGFGGQEFIVSMLAKIEQARAWKESGKAHFTISVDGGVDQQTTPRVVQAGADRLVAGTAVFRGDIHANIHRLREVAVC